jgi:hypothetical protein
MSKELQPHQLRVIEEKRELSEKIFKLEKFFESGTAENICAIERTMLTQQVFYMKQYEGVLRERIKFFHESLNSALAA